MKRFLSIAATVLIAMLVLVWSVQAQTETGTITGTITDPTGAVVPDAKVTARNVATNAVRVVTTNTAGTYIVSNLIPADYLVIVEAGGFTTQHYGRPAERIHAVQVELARRLYLDETSLRPLPTFESVRHWCRGLVARLAAAALSPAP